MLHKLNGKAGRGNGQTPRANTPDINPGQNPLTRTKPPSVKANIHIFIPSIHPLLHGLSARRCPLTSSLGEFPGYWDWIWYPAWDFARVGVQPFSLRLPHLGVFHSLFFACHWISLVYFSR